MVSEVDDHLIVPYRDGIEGPVRRVGPVAVFGTRPGDGTALGAFVTDFT